MRSPKRSFNRAAKTGVSEISGTSSSACCPRLTASGPQKIDRRSLLRCRVAVVDENSKAIESNANRVAQAIADGDDAGIAQALNCRSRKSLQRVFQQQRPFFQFFDERFVALRS